MGGMCPWWSCLARNAKRSSNMCAPGASPLFLLLVVPSLLLPRMALTPPLRGPQAPPSLSGVSQRFLNAFPLVASMRPPFLPAALSGGVHQARPCCSLCCCPPPPRSLDKPALSHPAPHHPALDTEQRLMAVSLLVFC